MVQTKWKDNRLPETRRGSTLELWTTSWAAVRTRTESDHNPALLHIAHILGDAPNLSREHQRRSVD